MQADLNQCLVHSGETKDTICEKCKKVFCGKCSKEAHKTQKGHAPFQFDGRLIETHEFLGFLGRGGYGYVLSAMYPLTEMKYALKIVDNVNDEAAFKEASSEIKSLCKLQHPNIIKFHTADFFKDEERIVIHMELADCSLRDVIKALDPATALKYFTHICEGLKFLHDRHFIHRDMKPGNVLILDEVAKLSDFGLTKKREKTMISLSDKANLLGTLTYLPPEVLKGEKYNEKSDVWALGIIFHQMISGGVHPFAGESSDEDTKLKILNPIIKLDAKITKNSKFEKIVCGKTFFLFSFFFIFHSIIIAILFLGCLEHDIGKRLSVKEILDVFKSNINEIVSPIEEKKETQAKPMKLSQPKSKNLKMENVFL